MAELTSDPQLRLVDLDKTYPGGHHALRGVSLDVADGEVVVIIGPSGCGKSTLLRTINGLEPINSGQILFDGTDLAAPGVSWPEVRRRIGMVFQSYELFPHLTVMGNLTLAPGLVAGESRADASARALTLLERVGLADRADDYPRQLSGGQRQRVAIVRALMMDPEILLLDEVTASLDPEMVREVLDVVLELARTGMTMLIVTHEMGFARAIADRIVFMDEGRIVEVDPPRKFFADPSRIVRASSSTSSASRAPSCKGVGAPRGGDERGRRPVACAPAVVLVAVLPGRVPGAGGGGIVRPGCLVRPWAAARPRDRHTRSFGSERSIRCPARPCRRPRPPVGLRGGLPAEWLRVLDRKLCSG